MKLSIIVPAFNEESVISELKERLEAVLHQNAYNYEIIVVDDGSKDKTAELVKQWIGGNPNVTLLEFSRNFGHQPALTAGLKESTGDAVIMMDADLQDPPEVIPDLVNKWEEGNKIVLTEKIARSENFVKKFIFNVSYKIFDSLSDLPIPLKSGTFGLMDRIVVNHLLEFKEKNRFVPGLRNWLGFQTAVVEYKREARTTGKAKTYRQLLKYGSDAVFSFSYKPLRISFWLGCIVTLSCFVYAFILLGKYLLNIDVLLRPALTVVAIFFLGGVILISNGIIGEYLGRIYDEIKNRPLYIVAKKTKKGINGLDVTTAEYAQITRETT